MTFVGTVLTVQKGEGKAFALLLQTLLMGGGHGGRQGVAFYGAENQKQ